METTNGTSFNNQKLIIPAMNDVEQQNSMELEAKEDGLNHSKLSQWLRAAVPGANNGLVSIASLMTGIGAVKKDTKAMLLHGFVGLVAGACSMALDEFVSMYWQLDIKLAQIKRDNHRREIREIEEEKREMEALPNPLLAAAVSALLFSVGAMVPLLAASFIREYKMRLCAVISAVSLVLLVFGWLGAVLGKAPTVRSAVRVLIGGWLSIAITFGLAKLTESSGL